MDLSALTRAEKLELLALDDELSRRKAIVSFSEFVRQAWHVIEPGTPYVHGWHVDAIAEHLEAVADGRIRNLIVNMPPRHSKSTLICVMFPAWVWIRRPDLRFLYASYSYNLSKRDSLLCRRIVESDWYRRRFDIAWRLASDQNEKMRFDNTRTGHRIATSVGGSVTGQGGDFLMVDDPLEAADVYSEPKRKGALTWYDEAFSTRGNDPKTVAKVVVMQRLHEEDLSGHLLSKQGGEHYDHLVLPAEYEGPGKPTSIGWTDPRKTMGELLWPARFGPNEIKSLKEALGEVAAAGQLQQHPSALDGDIIKRDWIQEYQVPPAKFDEKSIFADLTYKEGTTTDYTVVECWGRVGQQIYLIDQIRARMDFPAQLNAIRTMSIRHPEAFGKYIEEAANGAAVISTLKNEIMGIIPWKPMTSKEARLASVSPIYQAKNVHYPSVKICPWVGVNLSEILTFPNAKHDDTVDVASMAVHHLGSRGSALKRLEALTKR